MSFKRSVKANKRAVAAMALRVGKAKRRAYAQQLGIYSRMAREPAATPVRGQVQVNGSNDAAWDRR